MGRLRVGAKARARARACARAKARARIEAKVGAKARGIVLELGWGWATDWARAGDSACKGWGYRWGKASGQDKGWC